jgi:rhomboid family GlyGly-CTERM serine protease
MFKLNLPLKFQSYFAPAVVTLVAIACFFLPQSLSSTLIYDRQLIIQGDYWRIITGHFNHTNDYHLLLNLGGLCALWALHGDHYKIKSYLLAFLYIGVICSAALFMFTPEMQRYVGLSGILHGIFVWGAIKDIEYGWRSGYLLLIGVFGKIIWEQLFGASADVMALIESEVAIDAHLWGALAGLFFAAKQYLNNSQNRLSVANQEINRTDKCKTQERK